MSQLEASRPAVTLAETEDFSLEIGVLSIVPEWLKGEIGYRLRNKRTGLVEKEGNCLGEAIRALHENQKFLLEVDRDPKGENVKPPPAQPSLDDLLGLNDDN